MAVSMPPKVSCFSSLITASLAIRQMSMGVNRGRRFIRVDRNGKAVQHIDRLNSYLRKYIADAMPFASKEIREEDDEQEKLKQKDLQLQQLKERNRVDKNTIQSLRSQMKMLRNRRSSSEQ